MLPALAIALFDGDPVVVRSFALPILSALAAGTVAVFFGRKVQIRFSPGDGFLLVSLAWAFTSLFGAVPFMLSGAAANPADAVFESVSGFTTTGATIFADVEVLPRAILFWRAMTHWMGGMGIVVLTVALLPLLGVGGFQLVKAETPGPEKDKVAPKITSTAKILWVLYLSLTALQTALLMAFGMNWFDAVTHAFATMATGGFGTKNASIGAYSSPWIDWTCTVFMLLAGLAAGETAPAPGSALLLFATEIFGGLAFGFVIGWIALYMIGKTANYQVEIMVTLALAMSGYAMAEHAHVSAPIAIVVAGLMVGSRGRATALTEATRYRLDDFWELVDEILNAVLFVIIGLEVLAITMTGTFIVAGLVAIPLVLVARLVSVGLPFHLLRRHRHFEPGFLSILTWGGLRGGISVALALSLPEDGPRDLILTVTYIVVVFSVLVQGLTLGPLVRTIAARSERATSPRAARSIDAASGAGRSSA
ncbi:MAG: hypothetical protein HC834_10510 [Rhodospirillales bacterium]|nr:hypothetical protein [Rhodospirillales bacterium]